MLKLLFAAGAILLAAGALWRQTKKPDPRYYLKIHVVGAPGQPGHPEYEAAVRTAFAASYRRKRSLTALQLLMGAALCGAILVALGIAAIVFTHQHFHIKERLGLERPAPAAIVPVAP